MEKTTLENITDAETIEQANFAATVAHYLQDAVEDGEVSTLDVLDAMASCGLQLRGIETGKNVPSLAFMQIIEGSLGEIN